MRHHVGSNGNQKNARTREVLLRPPKHVPPAEPSGAPDSLTLLHDRSVAPRQRAAPPTVCRGCRRRDAQPSVRRHYRQATLRRSAKPRQATNPTSQEYRTCQSGRCPPVQCTPEPALRLILVITDGEHHLAAHIATDTTRGVRQLRLTTLRAADQIQPRQGVVRSARTLATLRFLLYRDHAQLPTRIVGAPTSLKPLKAPATCVSPNAHHGETGELTA
jgi:hypothetical protein